MSINKINKAKKAGTVLLGTALMAGLLFLNACASKKAKGFNAEEAAQFYGQNMTAEQEQALLAKKVYYFGYDRFDLSQEDTLSVYAHAKQLIDNPNSRIRIEGHTDNRGSREYNIALGERRANAILSILGLKGAKANQIAVLSYGKERPAADGQDEASWSQNRRAEVIYEN
ncbi:MAG: peptidoglycan-associated lipoprotein Pal [Gammaproteobacteria bacterium]